MHWPITLTLVKKPLLDAAHHGIGSPAFQDGQPSQIISDHAGLFRILSPARSPMTAIIPAPDARTDTLVFDLDGTLVDSLADLAAALNRLLVAEARPALDEPAVRRMVGDGVAKLVSRGFAACGAAVEGAALEALVERFKADYEPRAAELTRPYPGAAEALSSLKAAGWRLAVCTNKPQAATLHILEATGLLPHLQAIGGGDRFPFRKPDPRHLTATVAEAGSVPARAVMIGDGPQDLAAAQAAPMRAIAALYGYGGLQAQAGTPSIAGFAELPAALREAMHKTHG